MESNTTLNFNQDHMGLAHVSIYEQLTTYSQNKAEQHFDSLAEHFEGAYNRAGYPDPQKCAEYVDKLTKKFNLKKDAMIVDFACGTGLVGKELKELGFPNVYGLDISQKLLDIAKEKKAYKELQRVELGKDDYKEFPPLLKGKADFVTCTALINGNPLDEKIIEQMLLCLKPGGIMVFAARYSFIGKFFYQTKFEELEKFERLKYMQSDSFFKYDKLGIAVGKFRKTPVKVYAYQKTERDSVLGVRRMRSMRADEIQDLMSQGVMKLMQKKMLDLSVTEKISGKVGIQAKKVQDFRGGA